MGTLFRDKEHWCRTCGVRVKKAQRETCASLGHTLEVRESKTWRFKYHRDGRQFIESSGTDKKGEARKMLARREGKIAEGVPVTPAIGRMTFDEGIKMVLDDYRANGKRSLDAAERRATKHLIPAFGGRRLSSITTADVLAYTTARQAESEVVTAAFEVNGKTRPERRRKSEGASNAAINRELALLKRVFSLAIKAGLLFHRPHIPMLKESNVRTGFFEAEQYEAVLRLLPEDVRPVVTFAYRTGWRTKSEILPLEWRQVDFAAGEIRLDAGTTKNGEGRVFPMTAELRALLEGLHAEHEARKKAGRILPWVFVRAGKRIADFRKAFETACRKAGCPGRVLHDLRRTAVRDFVRAGIPERVAMMMTGHKTRSVFERYNITSSNDLLDAARRLDDRSGFVRVSADAGQGGG